MNPVLILPDEHRANRLWGSGQVEVQDLPDLRPHKEWRGGEVLLQFLEGLPALVRPRELLGLPQGFEERKASFSRPRDKSTEGDDLPIQLLDFLFGVRMPHVDDGLDFLWVGLDSSLRDEESEELPRSYPEGTLGRVQLHPVSS